MAANPKETGVDSVVVPQAAFFLGQTLTQRSIDLSKKLHVSEWIDPFMNHVLQKLFVDKDHTDEAVLRAVSLLLDGEAAAARAMLDTHRAADALVVISVAFTCDKMHHDALRSARQAVDAQDSNAAIWLWLCASLCLADASDTELDKAITTCLAIDPSDSMVRFTKALFLHFVRNELEGAKQEYKQAIEADPDNSNAHKNYGRLLQDEQDYAGAEREYKEAIRADQNNSYAQDSYGWLLKDVRQDYEKAEHEFKLAIQLNPDNSCAHNGYGSLLKDVRCTYDGAEREFELAIKADPNNSDARYNYGIFHRDVRGDYAGAEREFDLAFKADASNSVSTHNLEDSRVSGIGGRANCVQRRAEKASEIVNIGLDAVNVVLGFGKALPFVGGVCAVARDVLIDVRKFHDRADDVIAAGRRVVNVLQTLQWLAENTKKLKAEAQRHVKRGMQELERLLSALREAVRAFGRPGFFKTMFRAAKDAKTLKRLDRDIRDALDMLRVAFDLGRDDKFDQLIENQRYALEEAIEKQVQERINTGESNPVEGLETEEASIRDIAIDGGVSDDVFREELDEFPAKMREHIICASHSHSMDDIRNKILTLQQERADYLARHYMHVALPDADPTNPEHVQSTLGRGFFGMTHKMRAVNCAVIDRRELAVKLIPMDAALRELSEDELYREVVVLATLDHEHVVKYHDASVVRTPWLGRCLAIVMEFVPGGTLRERIKSPLKVETAAEWLCQLASALEHVHGHLIQHRDLKLDNVLLDARAKVPPPASALSECRLNIGNLQSSAHAHIFHTLKKNKTTQVRVIDFGLACIHKSPSSVVASRENRGARLYASPEKAQGLRYGYKDDIWGFGCIGASLLTGRPLESRVSGRCDFALQGPLVEALKVEVQQRIAPECAGHVIVDCLEENPAKRPTASTVVRWFRDGQTSAIPEEAEPAPALAGVNPPPVVPTYSKRPIDLSKLPRVSDWIYPYIKHVLDKLLVNTDETVLKAIGLLLDGDAAAARATLAMQEGVHALVVMSVALTCDKMEDDALIVARRALGAESTSWLWLCALLRLVDANDAEQDEAISKCLALDPSNSMVRFTKGRFLDILRKDYEGAEHEYKLAIHADPNFALAHSNYGILLCDARKDYDGAEREYRLAIKADPNNSMARFIYGILLESVRNDYSGAKEQYELAIEADPNNSHAHSCYGTLLESVYMDYEGAEREYKLAIEADPHNACAHNNYGVLLSDVPNNYAAAEREFKLAITADPGFSMAHSNYGLLLSEVHKDFAGAEREYKLAIKEDPNNWYAHKNYGYLLGDKLADCDGAVCEYERAIEAQQSYSMTDIKSRSAQVPRKLQEVSAAKHNVIVSHDGARIDLHGGGKDWQKPRHLTVKELVQVTDTFIVSLLHRKAISINVTYCVRLTDKSIKAIAKGCPELKELDVCRCKKLTDESIKAIARGCPWLNKLNVSSCYDLTDASIKAIAERCRWLKELNISSVQNLMDESIKAIAIGCPELAELNVHNTINLTDESIKAIAKGCPELKELNVGDIQNLTDESIKAIAKGCPELKVLTVRGIGNLTNESIKAIATGCAELKELNMEFVMNLTDESIKAIVKGCPELEKLNVEFCANLTDESIKAIAEGCPELKKLSVSFCRLGDSWLKAICEGCSGLEELWALGCGLVSVPKEIGDRLPHLRSLEISHNSVSVLPASICKLKDLQKLNVIGNPLQSPPIEIANQGLDAIKRYFEELSKGSSISKLLKVVLLGDGEAGKTTLRNALAVRPYPRQEDRTIHLDIEKITLTDELDINVYDCGGQEEYLATQLPYLTGLALYVVVVDANYATDEYIDALDDKLLRFLVVLQNRVPGAVVLPIVSKVDTVKDAERRCHWLESKIEKWLHDMREAVCCDRPDSSSNCPQPAPLGLAADANNVRYAGNGDVHNFIPLRVQSPALAVSVTETDDKRTVSRSVRAVRDSIIALTMHNPPLLRGVGQQIPSTYVAVLKLFGAIAEYGDNAHALEAMRDGKANALGESSNLSLDGTYRPKDELKRIWNAYRKELEVNVEGNVFDDATILWEAQGLIFVHAGLVFLQPEFITTIVRPLVDHRYSNEEWYKYIEIDVATFVKATFSYKNGSYNQLIHALEIFRDSGEIEIATCRKSLLNTSWNMFQRSFFGNRRFQNVCESRLLSYLWRNTGLDKRHYNQVLHMLVTSGVIFIVDRDLTQKRVAVIPYRFPKFPCKRKLASAWPPQWRHRQLRICFNLCAFPSGLAERFVADVHGLGRSLCSWRYGVVVSKGGAGYTARAERIGDALMFTVRFKAKSIDAAWKALCDAQQLLRAQRLHQFPGLIYEKELMCEQCWRQGSKVATTLFDAQKREFEFRPCGHRLSLLVKDQEEKSDNRHINYTFAGPVSGGQFIGVTQRDAYHSSREIS